MVNFSLFSDNMSDEDKLLDVPDSPEADPPDHADEIEVKLFSFLY